MRRSAGRSPTQRSHPPPETRTSSSRCATHRRTFTSTVHAATTGSASSPTPASKSTRTASSLTPSTPTTRRPAPHTDRRRSRWRCASTWEVTGLPILVTENGIPTGDDNRRIAYTTEALRGMMAAIDDGADVRGYLHWSLLDNYEWGHWHPTFGLIAVDRETFERKPKPSLAWLGDIARANGAPLIPAASA
ncbi:family 1 glycosylhydrolase [Streptomyces sp. GTA36]